MKHKISLVNGILFANIMQLHQVVDFCLYDQIKLLMVQVQSQSICLCMTTRSQF